PPEFTSIPRTTAVVGRQYTYTITTTDPENDAVHYSIFSVNPSVSPSITLSGVSQDTLTWSPSAPTSTVVTIAATDGTNTIYQRFPLSAIAAPAPISFTLSTFDPKPTVGDPYFFDPTPHLSNPDGVILDWQLAPEPSQQLPPGITIDPEGRITWPNPTIDANN